MQLRVTNLDLTSRDQIVDVIKGFFQGGAHSHQAVVPQDENLDHKQPRREQSDKQSDKRAFWLQTILLASELQSAATFLSAPRFFWRISFSSSLTRMP